MHLQLGSINIAFAVSAGLCTPHSTGGHDTDTDRACLKQEHCWARRHASAACNALKSSMQTVISEQGV